MLRAKPTRDSKRPHGLICVARSGKYARSSLKLMCCSSGGTGKSCSGLETWMDSKQGLQIFAEHTRSYVHIIQCALAHR